MPEGTRELGSDAVGSAEQALSTELAELSAASSAWSPVGCADAFDCIGPDVSGVELGATMGICASIGAADAADGGTPNGDGIARGSWFWSWLCITDTPLT